jgi:hypothetical protein
VLCADATHQHELSKISDGYAALSDTTVSGVSGVGGPIAAMDGMNGGNKIDPNTPLIHTETMNIHFAKSGVDDAKFTVPAGYKEEKATAGRTALDAKTRRN